VDNTKPIGPIGHDFEALVEQLPYWVRKTYYPAIETIDRVRTALVNYEQQQKKPEVTRTV